MVYIYTYIQYHVMTCSLTSKISLSETQRVALDKCIYSFVYKHPMTLDSYLTVNEQFANKLFIYCFPPITYCTLQVGCQQLQEWSQLVVYLITLHRLQRLTVVFYGFFIRLQSTTDTSYQFASDDLYTCKCSTWCWCRSAAWCSLDGGWWSCHGEWVLTTVHRCHWPW